MISNLNSIEDLSGKAYQYVITGIAVLFFSLLPSEALKFNKQTAKTFSIIIAYGAALIWTNTTAFSPFLNYVGITKEAIELYKVSKRIEAIESDMDFYKSSLADYREKPEFLPDDPNVIVIFTEGLSENIIEDERTIMPNVRKLKEKSIRFTDYYNHTAPTYKGILGQLTSGYQRRNLDRTGLTSLNEIFQDKGYYTAFINVEPNNVEFTDYLVDLGFNNVITDENKATSLANALSDKDAYELLRKTLESQDKSNPFFICIYTLGTHVSFYSPDERFGEGDNEYLNKFYNADYWFGSFFNSFINSDLADNTVLIYTTDHATWQDTDYTNNFSGALKERGDFTDKIPFYIYYKNGLVSESIEAGGRNSLDFAPTICDLLDINHENYFLGESLFRETAGTYLETMTSYEGTRVTTRNNRVEPLSDIEDEEFERVLERYYAVKKQSAEKKGLKDREGLG